MKQKKRITQKRNDATVGSAIVSEDFSIVVQNHRSQVFRFLLASSRDAEIAETLTQDCFLKAYRSWSHFRGESSPRTWLMRIAINLQKDYWRNRRIRFWREAHTNSMDLNEACDSIPGRESSVEQRVIAHEQVKRVWRIVEGLNERQRTVFLLRYVEDLELSQIARVTGLRESALKTHLSRALMIVRAELREVP